MPPSRYHLALTKRTAGVALVALVAALLGILSPSPRELHPPSTHASLFPAELLDRSPLVDRVFGAANDEDIDPRYPFGRWRTPATNVTFHSDTPGFSAWATDTFGTKRWHYSSFNTPDFFIGMAVVKLGYANDAFLYVVDKTAPGADKFEYSVRLPGSIGLTFASSSVDPVGCTTSHKPLTFETISFCYEQATKEWKISAHATTVAASTGEARLFSAELFLKREEALALLFPLGNDSLRPAYVHKAAGSPVRGAFSFGNVSVELPGTDSGNQLPKALGAIDWTRSLALRCTRWNWASSSFRGRVRTTHTKRDSEAEPSVSVECASVGINLSKDVYDIDGESQENAIWIDGKVYTLRGVQFAVPDDPVRSEWRIRTLDSVAGAERVDLTFRPQGSREDHTKLFVMESDFVQPCGAFSGHILFVDEHARDVHVEVADAFGVVEQHFAIW